MNIISITKFEETEFGLTALITYQTKSFFKTIKKERTAFVPKWKDGSFHQVVLWWDDLKHCYNFVDIRYAIFHEYELSKFTNAIKDLSSPIFIK